MSQVFDPRHYMAERKLQDPVPVSDPAQFPHEEYVPEGAHLLTGLKDEWGYNVDIRRTVYKCKSRRQLELIALVPVKDDPDETCTWPCVVYSQGSAFHEEWLCNHLIRHIRLASSGYVVAIAQYRPSETAPFPAQAQDVKSAIRFVRKNAELFHVDPEHIAVAGDFSGGHTALMTGFTGDGVLDDGVYNDVSCKVSCIVDCYGPTVFSLMNYWPSSQNHWDPKSPEGYEIGIKNVLEEMEESDKTIPMNYLSEDKPTPPTLIINGSRDMLVPASQSTLLYETMKKLGKEVEYYRIVDGNHGFIGWNNDTVLNIVLDFLKEHITCIRSARVIGFKTACVSSFVRVFEDHQFQKFSERMFPVKCQINHVLRELICLRVKEKMKHGAGLIEIAHAYYGFFADRKAAEEPMIRMAKAMGIENSTSGQDFINALDNLIVSVGCADLKMSAEGITEEELKFYPAKVHEVLGGDITAVPLFIGNIFQQVYSLVYHDQVKPGHRHTDDSGLRPVSEARHAAFADAGRCI